MWCLNPRLMKLPNGYGSVIRLYRYRHKPYVARVTVGGTDDDNFNS